jgi:hypothetical protein
VLSFTELDGDIKVVKKAADVPAGGPFVVLSNAYFFAV